MALNSAGIFTGIAALSISGVTVKDITAIPDAILTRDCPILFPAPDAVGQAEAELITFGPGMWEVTRTFEYIYAHAEEGTGRGLRDHLSAINTNLDAIITAIVGLDVSGVDVVSVSYTQETVVTDPVTKEFWGKMLTITLLERINA